MLDKNEAITGKPEFAECTSRWSSSSSSRNEVGEGGSNLEWIGGPAYGVPRIYHSQK